MALGYFHRARVLFTRGQITRSTLQEETRGFRRMVFYHLAHSAHEIRGKELVLPGQRGRMAGVIDQRGHDLPFRVGDSADHQRLIGLALRIKPAKDAFPLWIWKTPIVSQCALPFAPA